MAGDKEKAEPSPAKRRVFVAWDFEDEDIPLALESIHTTPPPGTVVDVAGLAPADGEIWRDVVEPFIAKAEFVKAIVNLPNANVAFEVGYATGKGKPTQIAWSGESLPAWVDRPPFKAHVVQGARDLAALRAFVAANTGFPPPGESQSGEATLLLCPSQGPQASAIYDTAKRHAGTAGWRVLPETGWTLKDLPEKLAGVGRVVWIIAPFSAERDRRDGQENAPNGAVAGFALARGRRIEVLRHEKARIVRDVQHLEASFKNLADLASALRQLDAPSSPPPDLLTLHLAAVVDAHRNLVPFFSTSCEKPLGDVYVRLALAVGPGKREKGAASGEFHENAALAALTQQLGSESTLETLLGVPIAGAATGRYAVRGDPGAGKSTICRRACFDAARGAGGIAPVFFSLARWARESGKHPFDLAEADLTSTRSDAAGKGLAAELTRLAREGRVWLFADGLDEVPEREAGAIRAKLLALANNPALARCRIVVTTRSVDYEPLGAPFVEVELQALRPDRSKELLSHWLKDAAAAVWARIEDSPRLLDLAENPLLLTLLAMLARDDQGLPPTRTKLYERAVLFLLKHGHDTSAGGVKDEFAAAAILAPLSLLLHASERETWTEQELNDDLREKLCAEDPAVDRNVKIWPAPRDFLRDVMLRSGIFGSYGGADEPWRFMHRSLREYLAAKALVKQRDPLRFLPGRDGAREDQEKHEHTRQHWAEVYGLAAGLAAADPTCSPLLPKLRESFPEVALRILPQIEGISPAEQFRELVATKDWHGEVLLQLVQIWRRDRVPDAAIRAAVWPREGLDLYAAACADYALSEAGIAFDRAELLRAAGVQAARPEIDVVRLPPKGARQARFQMGSPDGVGDDDEHPQHDVTLSPFQIGTAPVTAREYAQFDSSRKAAEPELPVVDVSWYEARLFCLWLGGRLPTEAEWEYACRGGTETKWWTGDTEKGLEKAAWYYRNSNGARHAVRKKKANPFGLYDVHGNVLEWCGDWRGDYASNLQTNPTGPARGAGRVIRGGCFWNVADWARSAFRDWWNPGFRGDFLGFRVVLPAPCSVVEDG